MFQEFRLEGAPWPIFWLFVALGVLIQGIGKTGFGGGVAVLSIPLMMLVMPVDKVAATLLPLLILLDFNAVYHHWKGRDWRRIRELYVPCFVGILLGMAAWWWIGREGVDRYGIYVKRFVGGLSLVFAIYVLAHDRAAAWASRLRSGSSLLWPTGILGGFASALVHAGGPILSLYLYTKRLGKSLFVGTLVWTFMLVNLTKLPLYIATGMIRRDVLMFDLWLVPLVPVGSWLGKWLHDHFPERTFYRIVFVFILIAAAQLIVDVNLILKWFGP